MAANGTTLSAAWSLGPAMAQSVHVGTLVLSGWNTKARSMSQFDMRAWQPARLASDMVLVQQHKLHHALI